MTSLLEKRIEQLSELGYVYQQKSRNFIHPSGAKIDHDIVVYGTDLLFEKHLKKLKI